MLLYGVSDRVRCRPDVHTKGDFKRVASHAQQESQSMSQNIRLGIQYRREQRGQPVGYDEGLVRKLIEKVIVYDDSFRVVFKSGVDVNIEA